MADFTNTANSIGDVNTISTALTAAVTIQLVDGLTMTKSADKASWADGLLTYTIVIENTGADDYLGVTITDNLDPAIIALVTDSVMIDGTAASYTYDDVTGDLVIIPDASLDIAAGGTVTITFQVQKA